MIEQFVCVDLSSRSAQVQLERCRRIEPSVSTVGYMLHVGKRLWVHPAVFKVMMTFVSRLGLERSWPNDVLFYFVFTEG